MKSINKKSTGVTRRDFLTKTGISLAAIAATGTGFGIINPSPVAMSESKSSQNSANNGILKKGQVFNESEEFSDKLTGRASRRLTRFRRYNQQPTYHVNTCFSSDSRYMILTTDQDDGSTALLRAEVATGEMTVLEVVPKGQYLYGNVIQAIDCVASVADGKIKLYNLKTLEQRTVFENASDLIMPVGSCDGKSLFVMKRADEVKIDGASVRPAIHCQIDLATGELKEIFRETRAGCGHVVPCPTDPDLVLIDRNWPRPPENPFVEITNTSRVWILNIRTKELTEIRPIDTCRFQDHSNWSFKGEYVYYHGTSKTPNYPTSPTGLFIGVADRKGKVIWEGHFPSYYYGHVSSHTKANVIITDAFFTKNLITAIYWQELNSQNIPRIEILARHDSDWVAGQQSHPHPHMSPDGKWLSYNRGESSGPIIADNSGSQKIVKNIYGEPTGTANRSDVCVVRL
jgi:hypothetical protein